MENYIIRPQEIYLLERYSSPAYFKEMRDAFATNVRSCLNGPLEDICQ